MTAARRYHSTDPRQLPLMLALSGDWVSAAPANDVVAARSAPRADRRALRPKRGAMQFVLFTAEGLTWIDLRPAPKTAPARPMSVAAIVNALGGQGSSGAQRDAMQEELQVMYDRFQAHACVVYGDARAAVLTFKLFTKLEVPPPTWLHGLFVEQREALEEAFADNGARDRDEDYGNHDIYEDEAC